MIPQERLTLARCHEVDPELFFPEDKEQKLDAMGICETCPIKQECYGEAARITGIGAHGVWGGVLWTYGKPSRSRLPKRAPRAYVQKRSRS